MYWFDKMCLFVPVVEKLVIDCRFFLCCSSFQFVSLFSFFASTDRLFPETCAIPILYKKEKLNEREREMVKGERRGECEEKVPKI